MRLPNPDTLKVLCAVTSLLSFISGCGYRLKDSSNPLRELEGVTKVYVKSVVNNTYKQGIETSVYNSVLKRFRARGTLRLVTRESDADAVLESSVVNALRTVNIESDVRDMKPAGLLPEYSPYRGLSAATGYVASLTCSFRLLKGEKLVWSGQFSRARPFTGSNTLGFMGVTSALINESEFERILGELADLMMDDVHESMVSIF